MITRGIFGPSIYPLVGYTTDPASTEHERLGYLMHPGHRIGAIAYRNLAANTPEAVGREMEFHARRSRRVKKPAFHLILSLHPSEKLEPSKLIDAAEHVVARLGLAQNQAVYAIHTEREHLHCHVAINRVGPEGKAWDMWRSAQRIRAACREVEREMGLVPHEIYQRRADKKKSGAIDVALEHPSNWSLREVRAYEKSGVLPSRLARAAKKEQSRKFAGAVECRLRPLLEQAESWDGLVKALDDKGFEIALVTSAKRRRGLQIVEKASSRRVAASAIGREFSLLHLESRLGPISGEWKREWPEQAKLPVSDFLPEHVRDAHKRMTAAYHGETRSARAALQASLQENRHAEKLEVQRLKVERDQRWRLLQAKRLGADIMRAIAPSFTIEYRNLLQQTRSVFKAQREAIGRRFGFPSWIDFVERARKELVQDAIAVFAWLKEHLLRRESWNSLEPPQKFEQKPPQLIDKAFLDRIPPTDRDWALNAYARLRNKLLDDGSVAFVDPKGQVAFIDRGRNVVFPLDPEEYPNREHILVALLHAQRKWGTSTAVGTGLFLTHALNLATRQRIALTQRVEERLTEMKRAKNPKFWKEMREAREELGIPWIYGKGERFRSGRKREQSR